MNQDFNPIIIDNIKFSYSSLSSFNLCKNMFSLTYLDYEERESGFFGEFGLFCHLLCEKFFKGELEVWDLAKYYEEHYSENVVTLPPPYPVGMGEKYFLSGLEFFENFKFNRENYEVISIEDSFDSEYNGIKLIIKPDLILRNKKNGNYVLLDYKTYKLKDNKNDDERMDGYKKQLYIYSYFTWLEKKIEINKIFLWFIRNDRLVEIEVNPLEIQKALDWIEETVARIKSEVEFEPNLSKKNEYFCFNICSCKNSCKYRNGELNT